MVIGSLFFRRQICPALMFALAVTTPLLRLVADDQIIKKDGTVIPGTVLSVSDGQVMFESRTSNGGVVKLPYYLTDIKTVNMAAPDEVTKVQAAGTDPAAVIAALDPQIKKFAGLPADWVVVAMAQLGDAYTQAGQTDKAIAAYKQISQFYPGSAYEKLANAGLADLDFKAGKIDDAMAILQPIIDQANKDIAPSPTD
jgi:tetratricopeptide (TPR) repeat protein